jgi:hypothetical protein
VSGQRTVALQIYGRRRLTRIEAALYVAVVAVLIVVFSAYLLDYMEMAEKAAMQMTLNNLNAGLNNQFASRLIKGESTDLGQWIGHNPFQITQSFPENYAGILGDQELASLERPVWVFDADRGEVVYLPRLHKYLDRDKLRFKILPRATGFGVALVATTTYSW